MTFYYRELTANLRIRQVSEGRVVEALTEVRDLCAMTGQTPQEQFGSAGDYARTFPRGKGRSPVVRAFLAFVVVCLLAEFVFLVRSEFMATRPPSIGGVPILILLVAAQVVAMLVTFGVHYRLPKAFTVGDVSSTPPQG